MWPYELRQLPRRGTRYVRYWHKADMLNPLANVRFWGQSGHDSNGAVMSAMTQSGHSIIMHSTLNRELDPLGKWQFGPVIDCVGRATHVALPGIRPSFSATSCFFLTAERAADLRSRGSDVYIGDAAV